MSGTNSDRWLVHQPPRNEAEADAYDAVRESAKNFAKTVLACTPDNQDRSEALRKIREALLSANASISCGGDDAAAVRAIDDVMVEEYSHPGLQVRTRQQCGNLYIKVFVGESCIGNYKISDVQKCGHEEIERRLRDFTMTLHAKVSDLSVQDIYQSLASLRLI